MHLAPLLTPSDIAARLGIKKRTAYDYLSPGGPLHHLRVDVGPRLIRVRPEDFEKYLREGGVANDR